jgi:hypothetical protein
VSDDVENTRKLNDKIVSFLLAAVLLSNVFIFPSIFIYLGNIDHFSISLFGALKIGLVLFALSSLTIFFFLRFFSPHHQKLSGVFFAALSILFWVQGSILVWDFGSLDGRNIEWHEHQSKLWIDAITWLVLSGILLFVARKRSDLIIGAASFVFVLQVVTIVFSLLENSPALLARVNLPEADNIEDMPHFSKHQNIIHIIADGFQSDVFEDLINSPDLKGKYHKDLDGFVFYRETLGIFPVTRFSVPAFLSGNIYSNDKIKNDYIDDVLAGKTIMSVARDHQFEIDLVAEGDYHIARYVNLPHNNIFDISKLLGLNSALSDSGLLLDMSLFRVMPGLIKKYIYNEQKWRISHLFIQEEFLQFKFFTSTIFLNYITSAMTADREAPVYKYLHVMNTHNPMVVTEDCKFAGGVMASSRQNLTFQSKCTLDTLSGLFNKLRELGVYDDALIILQGDHGGWVGVSRPGPDIIFPNGRIAEDWLKSLASPLLAIKRPKARGGIVTSNALASLVDIPDTINDIMGWNADFDHMSLIKLDENEDRTRHFRFYFWQKDDWQAEYTDPILEFSIDGSHFEAEWKAERVFFPPEE